MKSFRYSLLAIIGIALVGAGCFSAPRAAEAQLATYDAANFAVNTTNLGVTTALSTAYQARKGPGGSGIGLDTLAWQVGKIAIQTMTKSMVNWINSGFNGSPAFVTDLQAHLQGVGDVVAGALLNQIASSAGLKSPFQSQLVSALTTAYFLSTADNVTVRTGSYNLNQYSSNDAAFLRGNFAEGGWTAWYHAVTNPQNNPFGAEIVLEDDLHMKVTEAQGNAQIQLNWGQGFLSWCGDKDPEPTASGEIETVTVTGQVCIGKDGKPGTIKTPGSVIQSQINQTLGLTGNTLVTADEFNEVIGALMSQLVSQVLGAGLSGISGSSSGGNGYLDQATNPSQITSATQASNSNALTLSSVQSSLAEAQQYQTDWKTIGDEAKLADANVNTLNMACVVALSTLSDAEKKAQTESTRADAAVTALTKIQNDASSATTAADAGTGSATALTNVSTELQQFLASSTMPSAVEIAFAHAQAADNSSDLSTSGTKPTIYTFLSELAAGRCPADEPILSSNASVLQQVQGSTQ
jgi:hypothetical protein